MVLINYILMINQLFISSNQHRTAKKVLLNASINLLFIKLFQNPNVKIFKPNNKWVHF
jgi:hypothetical protein